MLNKDTTNLVENLDSKSREWFDNSCLATYRKFYTGYSRKK